MTNTPQAGYTAIHGSCAESRTICEQCQKPFLARIRRGENRDRFCSPICRYRYHNERRAEKRNPPSVAAEAAGLERKQQSNATQHNAVAHPLQLDSGTKIHAIATALYRGERLDCFSAVRRFHDYVLRSTISELKRRYGIQIDRQMKQVPGFSGKLVSCAEYSAREESRCKLGELLGRRYGKSQRSASL